MIGYKKCYATKPDGSDRYQLVTVLVELEIPEDAQWQQPPICHDPESEQYRFMAIWSSWSVLSGKQNHPAVWNDNTERKCRADKAKVLKIHGGYDTVYSMHDPRFTYKVGEILTPELPYDTGGWACGSGIHFFLEKETAIDYANSSTCAPAIVDPE